MPSCSAGLRERFVDDLTDYAVIVLDLRGKVLTWNAGACALFGYDSEDAMGRDFSDLHTKADSIKGRPDMALEVLQRDERIDLLLTDVVMPGALAGRELAERALEIRPNLKVLFTSGYFEGALVNKGALQIDVQFIAKPYRLTALADKVAEVLSFSP